MNTSENNAKTPIRTAKFVSGLKTTTPIKLTFGVSMGNEKQKGQDLESFVNLVNRHKTSISKVQVLVGAYLHRHYVGEEAAIKKHNEYIKETKEIFDKLQVPYEFVDWKDAIANTDFEDALVFVKGLYNSDSEFKTKVDLVSKSHLQRGDIDTIKAYLLEECAYFKFKKGYFSYPVLKLNAACEYVIEKYNPDFHFKSYTLTHPVQNNNSSNKSYNGQKTQNFLEKNKHTSKSNLNNMEIPPYNNLGEPDPEYLMICCSQLSMVMRRFGLLNTKEQENYFSRYLKNRDNLTELLSLNAGTTYENEATQTFSSIHQ